MNKTKILICMFFFYFASTVYSEHTILGTDTVYKGWETKIISDILVNDLQIRHVRHTNSDLCAERTQHHDFIEMNGPINPDTPFIFERLLKKIDDSPNRCTNPETGNSFAVKVYMNSGGGFMEDGYKLGELFRAEGVQTHIPWFGGECYSSCATAFLGGRFRRMGEESKLMFHAPYSYSSRYDVSCSSADNRLLSYMKTMLDPADGEFLYKRTMSYCSQTSGWSLNKDAAELFGLLKLE